MKFPNSVSSYPKFHSFNRGSTPCSRTAVLIRPALVLAVLAVALPAFARPHIGVQHHYLAQGSVRHAQSAAWNERRHPQGVQASSYHPSGVVTVGTAAGPITVASDAADKFVSLVNDLVAHGFHGSVTCAASGHMPNSLHHTGHACDFAQTARNRTVGVMYHVGNIIAAHGLRDGCSFGDCGHVDTGAPLEGRRFAAASSRRQAERVAYQDRAGGQPAIASWSGAGSMTVARPQPGSYARMAARETGRVFVMRFPDRGAVARERFLEVSGGATRTFGFAHRSLARRRLERM